MFVWFPMWGAAGVEEARVWWRVDFDVSVTGHYRYVHDGNAYDGEYAFKIHMNASLELDSDEDFILYQGGKTVEELSWKEMITSEDSEDGGPKLHDLSETVEPEVVLHYVLKERRTLLFDFEVFLKTPHLEAEHPFRRVLLPRSALNKAIHPRDRYNKGVKGGSNKVHFPEKPILKQAESEKSYHWQWQRKKDEVSSRHETYLTIKITRKESE